MINICIYLVFEKGQWEMGHFKMFQGEGTLYSLGNGTFYPLGTILSSGNRTTYPLGIGPLILWERSSGYRKFGKRVLTMERCVNDRKNSTNHISLSHKRCFTERFWTALIWHSGIKTTSQTKYMKSKYVRIYIIKKRISKVKHNLL